MNWLSPEEIVAIGFQRSRLVLMNEAHNGMQRCIRTRDVGRRILPVAHAAGVRHLAMEALFPIFAEQCNRLRGIPEETMGYLAQPDMQLLIQTAFDWAKRFSVELLAYGGTAGLLAEDIRTLLPLDLGADAFVLSLNNNMD